jgi:hypothetical protein
MWKHGKKATSPSRYSLWNDNECLKLRSADLIAGEAERDKVWFIVLCRLMRRSCACLEPRMRHRSLQQSAIGGRDAFPTYPPLAGRDRETAVTGGFSVALRCAARGACRRAYIDQGRYNWSITTLILPLVLVRLTITCAAQLRGPLFFFTICCRLESSRVVFCPYAHHGWRFLWTREIVLFAQGFDG